MGLFGSSGNYQRGLDKNAVDELQSIETPDIEGMKLQLQQLVQQGQLSPEEAQTYMQQSSAMNNISLDPKFKQAQMDALQQLQDVGNNHGVTAADQAQLNDFQNQEDTHARGAREAILQNAQARGVGGSGAELLSQMTNQQDAATRASQEGFNVAANAQQRALQSLQAAGQMGSQLQSNQFNQQATVANANDAINRFNTANQQNQENMNVGARNAAQQANLQNQQSIANQNVDIANKQQQYNTQLQQQNFQNQMQKGQSVAGALQKTGQNATAQQNKNDDIERGLIGSGLGAVGSAAGKIFSDEKLKKNVEEFNPSDFLDNLTSYKYNYKSPKHGEGNGFGPMAQDLEKSKAGASLVKNTPEGKMVDTSKASLLNMSALGDLHKRIKALENKK